jgi:hypothetical protein
LETDIPGSASPLTLEAVQQARELLRNQSVVQREGHLPEFQALQRIVQHYVDQTTNPPVTDNLLQQALNRYGDLPVPDAIRELERDGMRLTFDYEARGLHGANPTAIIHDESIGIDWGVSDSTATPDTTHWISYGLPDENDR